MEKVPVGDVGPSFKRQPSKLPRGHISGRRARFRLWSLTFIILVTTIHARAHSIVDTEPSIAETVDVLAKVPKSLREPSGSGAAVLVCASALCASWLSVLKYFALYRVHRGDAQK